MKYRIYLLIVVLLILLCGCSEINKLDSNIMLLSDDAFKYIGTWSVERYDTILSDNLEDNQMYIDKLSAGIEIGKDRINIFGSTIKNVRYKLKVVDKGYVISYENNITAEEIMGEKDKLDIISVIDNNMVLCEFAIIDNKNIIMIYKSLIIHLQKISNEVTVKSSQNNLEYEGYKEDIEEKDTGVMIGIKTSRYLKEDGSYTEDKYRTVWISYRNNNIDAIYEKEDIIFPRMNGIWQIKAMTENENEKKFDYFQVANLDGKIVNESNYDKSNSIYKSIKFIGNDYIAIEKYVGENFINEYPIYQIVPVDNINSNDGLSIEEIFNKDMKETYFNDYKNAFDGLLSDDAMNYKNDIDYTSISMDRSEGKWILKAKIQSIYDNNRGKDFTLSIEPNKKIINFNSLLIPWKILKGEAPFLLDSITSPNGEISIVRYNKYFNIYKIENGHLIGPPLATIPISENDEIIMTEWCSSSYINEWQKPFKDGISLIKEDE